MQFFTERAIKERSFSRTAPGQLGTLPIDTAGTYHQFKMDLLNGLTASNFSEFRLNANGRTIWNVDGDFLDARHFFLTGEASDDIEQLVIDLKEPRPAVEANRYSSSIPVAGVRVAGRIETLTIEKKLSADAPANSDVETRSIVSDGITDGQGNTPPPGILRSIHSFPVTLRKGEVIIDEFTEGGIPRDKTYLRRIWFKIDAGHIKGIQIRDNTDIRSEPTVADTEREQDMLGFTPQEGWFVLDPVLDRSEVGFALEEFQKFNLLLTMDDSGATALPDSMTIYAEYDGEPI
ncbi:MAG: major capsid protein P2 [Pseudomonadota bacterium]